MVNTARQLGGSIGIALMGAIVAYEVAGRSTSQAFVARLSTGLEVASGLALAGGVVAAVLVRNHVEAEHDDVGDAAPTPPPAQTEPLPVPQRSREEAAA